MSSANNNQKLPNTDIKIEYPWCQSTQYIGGHEEIWNNTPDNELIRMAHTTGTFKEWGQDGSERKLVIKTSHKVVNEGKSLSVEGPHDILNVSTVRKVVFGDDHSEGDQNYSRAYNQNLLHLAKNEHFHYNGAGDSATGSQDDWVHYVGSDDKQTSHHLYNAGDLTNFTGGNRYMQTAGEDGHYVQGNWDTQTDKKARLFSKQAMLVQANDTWDAKSSKAMTMTSQDTFTANAQSDITIVSQSKITIKVGQSTITISSSGVDIEAQQITINGQTTNITGHPLKLNGGGTSSPPVTFP